MKKTQIIIGSIIAIIALFGSLLLWENYHNKPETKRYVRKNLFSPEAKKDIEALNKALKIMREKDCNDPLSWYYQGAIHWIPDTIENNKLCESYHTFVDKKVAWDNCTHTPSGKEKIHFLAWHRLYIYHFEKIVRKLSGYKDFALPYWGYTNNTKTDKYMPPIFRDKNSALYESSRFDSLNNGVAINGEIERALDLTKLMSYTSYDMFCININAAPHGAIHDYIGHGNDPTGKKYWNPILNKYTEDGLMGWVPTAGFDPIFWMHHSNIDRIWQQWTNSKNGKEILLEELKSIQWDYVFFDENGKKVVYTMEDLIKILYTMDYDFDDTPVKPKGNDNFVTIKNHKVLNSVSPKMQINGQITDAVTLKPNGNLLTTNKGNVVLEIKISFNKRPKGVYEVYVNNNEKLPHPSQKAFAGFMTFFGADHNMVAKDCGGVCCKDTTSEGRTLITFTYEVPVLATYNISIYKHNAKYFGDMIIEEITIKR